MSAKTTKSYKMSQEAIKLIKEEAERLDRSASWIMNNLALQIKQK